MGLDPTGSAVLAQAAGSVILLDTNALLWLQSSHRRAGPLHRHAGSLYVSPVSLLEIQFLLEVGKVRLQPKARMEELSADPRWLVDDPSSAGLFRAAQEVGWTRDPFDRLLVGHARLRGWRLATGDGDLLGRLRAEESLEL